MNLIIKIWELLCVHHLGQVQNDNCTGVLSRSGGLALVGLFWQTICAVLIPGSWKWATNRRIILVSSQLVCSNLNHRAEPRRLETGSGNSISCVPNTCHHSVLSACPENLSKTATVSLDTCLHHGTQQGSCHNLDFSAWSCLCTRDLKWSHRGWRWHSTGCGPSSCSVTILSSPRFSSVGSNLPKNRALLQTGWVHCSASGERKGKECKTRWGYVRNKNAAGNTFHFIWAVIPSCAPSSVLILPSVFSCLLPKTGDFQAKAFSQQTEPGVQGEIGYSGVSCSRR